MREACGMGVTLPTSYGALRMRAKLRPTDCLLVHAGAGGLGLAAIQLAKRVFKCKTVIVTASSEKKLKVAIQYGADHGVNYLHDNWVDQVRAYTHNRMGVDVIFDSVGLVQDSIKCLAFGGRIIVVGFAGRDAASLESVPVNRILLKQAAILGWRFGETSRQHPAQVKELINELSAHVEAGEIRGMAYDEPYKGLEAVKDALEDLAARRIWGKAVIQITEESKL